MRYLVTARVKPGKEHDLLHAIESEQLGKGSVAQGEYLQDMLHARIQNDGTIRWVEVCFCATPLDEERPYWEAFFELVRVQDAHSSENCRDLNGKEPWACMECDCTDKLEKQLSGQGEPFVKVLRRSCAARVYAGRAREKHQST